MAIDRFDRNIMFFGEKGQQRLRNASVAVVGIGGVGTHVVQQLAFLGVGKLTLIEPEELDESNRNRYIGSRWSDPVPGTLKVDIGERIIKEIDPLIKIHKVGKSLVSEGAFTAVIESDYVFGCVDKEGSRLILNELCAAYTRPYIDLATEIIPGKPLVYGGRVCVSWDGCGCISCYDLIDLTEVQRDLVGLEGRRDLVALYGVKKEMLGGSGPAVISINGVIASLAVTEFMVMVTGIRPPNRLCKYYGQSGKVVVSIDQPASDCYYCKDVRGKGDSADVQRYIRAGVMAVKRCSTVSQKNTSLARTNRKTKVGLPG